MPLLFTKLFIGTLYFQMVGETHTLKGSKSTSYSTINGQESGTQDQESDVPMGPPVISQEWSTECQHGGLVT